MSDAVLEAFASVFGDDVLDAARGALINGSKAVTKLAAGEFPIIFVPRPGGRDLQLTPVSRATSFMGVKAAIAELDHRKKAAGLKIPYGSFEYQSISSKPQNISGAIGGPRQRIVARMPAVLEQAEADLHRYIHGGSFPRWREDMVGDWVLRYADMLEAAKTFNNSNTRAALDRTADRLIRGAIDFIEEIVDESHMFAREQGVDISTLRKPVSPTGVLMRRWWSDDTRGKARKALTSPHFYHRLSRIANAKEEVYE